MIVFDAVVCYISVYTIPRKNVHLSAIADKCTFFLGIFFGIRKSGRRLTCPTVDFWEIWENVVFQRNEVILEFFASWLGGAYKNQLINVHSLRCLEEMRERKRVD
jgi:hypothetical protein